MTRLPAVVALLAVLQAQGAGQPTFRAKIELVQVDVVVVDQAGNLVRGIKQTDFTLLDGAAKATRESGLVIK
jgi:hypothetical protein